jgi:putative transposase
MTCLTTITIGVVSLSWLRKMVDRYKVRCLELCLMRNHYHILLETPRANLSAAMKHIDGVYTQTSNRRHNRTGHVFEGRFRAIVIEPGISLRRAARYVVLNPIKARYVKRVDTYAWSSYRATAGLEPAPDFLHVEWTRSAFGGKSQEQAQARYRAYVNKVSPNEAEFDLEALAVGRPPFVAAVLEVSRMDHPELVLPLFSRALARPALSDLFAGSKRCAATRNKGVYAAHVSHGYSLAEIARFLRVHPSTCSFIFRRIPSRTRVEEEALAWVFVLRRSLLRGTRHS